MELIVDIRCENQACAKKMQVKLPAGSKGRAKVRCKTCKHLTSIDIDAWRAEQHRAAQPKAVQQRVVNQKETTQEGGGAKVSPSLDKDAPVLSLELTDDSGAEQLIVLPLGTFILGRGEDTSHRITLDDPFISRKHLALKVRQHPKSIHPSTQAPLPNCILKDYNSTNGTFLVNKEGHKTRLHKQDEIYLEEGSVFQIGNTKVTLRFAR